MNKLFLLSILILAIAIGGCGYKKKNSSSQDQPDNSSEMAAANTVCPITGDQVDPNISTTYKGQKVYFCCKGCIKKFNSDPEKYLAALK